METITYGDQLSRIPPWVTLAHERSVGYLKRNAIAGHSFKSLDRLQAHWMRKLADVRIHGTTGEASKALRA